MALTTCPECGHQVSTNAAVTFSDGFGDSTCYDLSPDPEDDAATAKGFAGIDRDESLRLQ